ncbi:hypothetical protein BH10PSE19_BH10PSE19_13800 [soil metagenome]
MNQVKFILASCLSSFFMFYGLSAVAWDKPHVNVNIANQSKQTYQIHIMRDECIQVSEGAGEGYHSIQPGQTFSTIFYGSCSGGGLSRRGLHT